VASSGPLYPGTAATLSNAGSSENAEAWVNPGNIVSDNGTESTITAATYDSPDISGLLVASNFGFAIPTRSTINGIVVEIDRRNSAGAASDNRVQLAKGTAFANLVGSNLADTATDWPTTTAVATYGGSGNLWGTTWTVAEINASTFAVMLSVQADAANTDIQVDFIRVTVHYTEDAAVPLPGVAMARGLV
jgi:predicted porin